MAIEISGKPTTTKKLPLADIFLFLAVFLLAGFFIAYFILFAYQKKLEGNKTELENSLTRTPAEQQLEERIFDYQKKIDDFGFLLDNHGAAANLFGLLEKACHPRVQFLNLALDLSKNIATVSGQAASYEVLGQQIFIFKNQTSIKKINLSGISTSKEGKVDFAFQITFDPALFK